MLTEISEKRLFPSMAPKGLSLPKGSKVFTIGSCFAREIEDALSTQFDFPVMSYQAPEDESYAGKARGVLNKFTPESMLRELEWLVALRKNFDQFDELTERLFLYQLSEDEVLDIGLHLTKPVSRQRFMQRRLSIFNIYKELESVDAVVVTLGNLEQHWLKDGRALESVSVNKRFIKAEYGALTVKKQGEDEVLKVVESLVALIRDINPAARIILTVSPVPMERTDIGEHIVLENFSNKLTLVRAAKYWAERVDNSYYFPSFEMVSFVGITAFKDDLRHVKPDVIRMIMYSFLTAVTA